MNKEVPQTTERILPLTLQQPWLIVQLSEAQNHRCCYCHLPMAVSGDLQHQNWNNMRTLEHVVPKNKGGCDCKDNLVAACRICNDLRRDVEVHVFAKIMDKLMAETEIREQWHEPQFLHSDLYKRIKREVCKWSWIRTPTLLP